MRSLVYRAAFKNERKTEQGVHRPRRASEFGKQRCVDTAREGHLAAALERREPFRQGRERARVENGVLHDNSVELRQLLPRCPHDAHRASIDTRPHNGDGVLYRRLPLPVEQRLRRTHPRRPTAREHDRAREHLSGRRAPGRAGSRNDP